MLIRRQTLLTFIENISRNQRGKSVFHNGIFKAIFT